MGSVMTAPSPAWPLQTRLPLAALPTAPSVARGHVRVVASEWGLADLADTAELLVSELVAKRRPGVSQAADGGISGHPSVGHL